MRRLAAFGYGLYWLLTAAAAARPRGRHGVLGEQSSCSGLGATTASGAVPLARPLVRRGAPLRAARDDAAVCASASSSDGEREREGSRVDALDALLASVEAYLEGHAGAVIGPADAPADFDAAAAADAAATNARADAAPRSPTVSAAM